MARLGASSAAQCEQGVTALEVAVAHVVAPEVSPRESRASFRQRRLMELAEKLDTDNDGAISLQAWHRGHGPWVDSAARLLQP